MQADAHFIVGALNDVIWIQLTDQFTTIGLYTAQRERTVEAIIKHVQDEAADLVFSEEELAEGNIFQLAEAMDQYGQDLRVPLLVMVGDQLSSLLVENAFEAGVDFAIEQPFRQDELQKIIRAALDRRKN